MKTLVISPDFTIEDIHKIREWNYFNHFGKNAEMERRRALKRKAVASV